MEEMVDVVPPLPQGVWRGCSSRGVAKQLPSRRQRSAARSLCGGLRRAPRLLPTSSTRCRRRWLLHRHGCPWSRNARGVWHGGRHTLRHLHVVHPNHGDEQEMNRNQLSVPYLARQMSWCGKPQPGGGMHLPKPRG